MRVSPSYPNHSLKINVQRTEPAICHSSETQSDRSDTDVCGDDVRSGRIPLPSHCSPTLKQTVLVYREYREGGGGEGERENQRERDGETEGETQRERYRITTVLVSKTFNPNFRPSDGFDKACSVGLYIYQERERERMCVCVCVCLCLSLATLWLFQTPSTGLRHPSSNHCRLRHRSFFFFFFICSEVTDSYSVCSNGRKVPESDLCVLLLPPTPTPGDQPPKVAVSTCAPSRPAPASLSLFQQPEVIGRVRSRPWGHSVAWCLQLRSVVLRL